MSGRSLADVPGPRGPGSTFRCLIAAAGTGGISLPSAFRSIYAGDWSIPDVEGRPYSYVNFAAARDGRVSFSDPGHASGGDITDWNAHDRWLMGLLRARADAVLVGDGTVTVAEDTVWTAEDVWPDDAAAFSWLRRSEGRPAIPTHVVLSRDGALPAGARVFNDSDLGVVVATTSRGVRRVRRALSGRAWIEILDLGPESVDVLHLLSVLRESRGVRTLLCEGGPRVYGSLLRARAVDDEFLTLCPKVLGDSPERTNRRPSLVEDVAFTPDDTPRSHLIALQQAGDYLFLRSRYTPASS